MSRGEWVRDNLIADCVATQTAFARFYRFPGYFQSMIAGCIWSRFMLFTCPDIEGYQRMYNKCSRGACDRDSKLVSFIITHAGGKPWVFPHANANNDVC